jgi:putative restriction endonuclease
VIRPADDDDRLRAAAFAFLAELITRRGVATWDDLKRFELEGRRIPLIGQTGIRKVRGYEPALTILTTYRTRPEDQPYQDDVGEDGYPRYKWRGTDPNHADNVALRRAMELGKPLAWLRGVDTGVYLVEAPVWLVDEEPERQQFVLALEELRDQWRPEVLLTEPDLVRRREYAERIVRQRLHQPIFRRQVLAAYRTQCALCRLRHGELLDAAHIKEDADGGEPVVPNGIAMCAIHHRAFDSFVVGVRPDYVIEVRRDVLGEVDGPTLQHALQGIHGSDLVVPARRSARPDRELLEARYERFRAAG